MEIILLRKVQNIGELGDVVKVKGGYARNYLIPTGRAMRATAAAKEEFEQRKQEFIAAEQEKLAQAKARNGELNGKEVTINRLASAEGKLFGSVSNADIADAFTAAGMAMEKSEMRMPEGALKELGEFEIDYELHPEVQGTVKVTVAPE